MPKPKRVKKASSSDEEGTPNALEQKNWTTDNIGDIYTGIKKNYIFTQIHFNKYMKMATSGGRYSHIVRLSGNDQSTQTYKVMKFMLTNFTPTDQQIKKIISCYKSISIYYSKFGWLDIMIEKNHQFTQEQIAELNNINYPNMNKLFGNNNFGIETLKYYARLINNGSYSEKEINDEIQNFKALKDKIPCSVTKEFLNIVGRNRTSSPGFELVKDIIDKTELDESIYDSVKNLSIDFGIVKVLLQKQKPPENYIKHVFSSGNIRSDLLDLFRLMIAGVHITETILNEYLKLYQFCRYEIYTDFDLSKISVSLDEMICLNCESFDSEEDLDKNVSIRTIDLFKIFKIPPSSETLKIICKMGYHESFDEFVNTYKMIPDKECLDLAMYSRRAELIIKLICYKINPDKDTFNSFMSNLNNRYHNDNQQVIELLIKNGLNISHYEIEKLISRGIWLDDLERFNFQYDEKLYFMCFKHNYFPDAYKKKFTVDENILTMREMCINPKINIEAFNQFILDKKLKPDQYCVDNAYINRTSTWNYWFGDAALNPSLIAIMQTSDIYAKFPERVLAAIDLSSISAEIMAKPINIQ